MSNSAIHFNLLAKEGATLQRIAPNKNDASVSYVDVAVIGATISGQLPTDQAAGLEAGQRVDCVGSLEISEFNNQKRYRFNFDSIKPARSASA